MMPDNFSISDGGSLCCYSCKSMYGSLYCDNCKYNIYDSGTEDKYQEDDSKVYIGNLTIQEKLKVKPNTLEIDVPEDVESIIINFRKNNLTCARICGTCDRINSILTSYPPKVQCPITGSYHNLDDICDIEE